MRIFREGAARKIFRFLTFLSFLALALLIFPVLAGDEGDPEITDPPDDQNLAVTGNTTQDILAAWFEQPNNLQLKFSLKVANLSGVDPATGNGLPTNGIWRMVFDLNNDTDADTDTYFVTMRKPEVGPPEFSWGFVDANGVNATQGPVDEGTILPSQGIITWVNTNGKFDGAPNGNGNPGIGDVLTKTRGQTRQLVGVAGTGLLVVVDNAPNDQTAGGRSFTLEDTGIIPQPPPGFFRTGNYQQFDFMFTPDLELPDQQRSTVFFDQDAEPELEIDRFGNIYVAAIRGVPGGVDFWRSDDKGATFEYLGQPDGTQNPTPDPVPDPEGGIGGGDTDLALGDPFFVVPPAPGFPGVQSTGRIYVTSLWLGSATLSVSLDRGDNWVPNPFTTAQLDRQWNVARGEKTLYMSLRKLAQIVAGEHDVFVVQSDDGASFTRGSFVEDPVTGTRDEIAGNVALTSGGVLYGSFSSFDGQDLFVYRCPKVGSPPCSLPPGPTDVPVFDPNSFQVGKVFDSPSPLITVNNVFPIMTVDQANNLHLAFGDRHNIYLMSCPAGANCTQAANWTKPVILNAPGVPGFEFTNTGILPWIRGGADGKVAAIWYGTEVAGDPDTRQFETDQVPWKLIYAQVEDAFAENPSVLLDVASQQGDGVIHKGQICVRGLGCPGGTRELLEYSSVAVDNDGFANIAYAGTIIKGSDPRFTNAITFFTKSTKRPLVEPEVTVEEFECDDGRLTRKGGWPVVKDERATNGKYCRNTGAKKANSTAFLEFNFTGTAVDMFIARGPRGGNAEVLIDGQSRGIVDFFRPPKDPSKPDNSGKQDLDFGLFIRFETDAGQHTFRLNVLNNKPESESANQDIVYVDEFRVESPS